jgi:hypothetical protein
MDNLYTGLLGKMMKQRPNSYWGQGAVSNENAKRVSNWK